MDVILMIFTMSTVQPLFEPPSRPQAVTVEVIKLDTDTVDVYSDMLDPNWINKNENRFLQKTGS